MKKLKEYLGLMLTMLKIGLFTFGGGYAMLALLENEFVSKQKWMEKDEFLDMAAIAESTPGPIAINAATYIGYKQFGILGSVFATLGICLPSFLNSSTISAIIVLYSDM
jgi:chromate transporter